MEAKILHTKFEEGNHLLVNGDTAVATACHKTVADELEEMSGHEVTQDLKFC